MKRTILFAAVALLSVALSSEIVWGRGGRGGLGGGGFSGGARGGGAARSLGGGGGARMSGARIGGGSALRSAGSAGRGGGSTAFRGGSVRSAPAIRSGGNLGGGNLAGLRNNSSIRSAPATRGNTLSAAPRSNLGSAASRLQPGNRPNGSGLLQRAGEAGSKSLGQGTLENRWGANRLGQAVPSNNNSSRLNLPGTANRGGLGNLGTQTNNKPVLGGNRELGGNRDLSRATTNRTLGDRTLGDRALGDRTTAGRLTTAQVDRFLGRTTERGVTRASATSGAGARRIETGRAGSLRPTWFNSQTVRTTQTARVRTNLAFAARSPVAPARGLGNWLTNNPARATHWNSWAGGVRNTWRPGLHHGYFNDRFWATHHVHFPFRRWNYWGLHPWRFWWGRPIWRAAVAILPPYWGWRTPYYYDYGPGGNVVYSSNYVYVGGQPVCTAEEYAASAAELATVPEPANPDEPGEWMALGTFALATSKDEKDPPRVIQLALDREGIISGTLYNRETDQTYAVQGRVDEKTQRVALMIGDDSDIVLETGLYNLTQDETPVLVHDGTNEPLTYLLVRLEAPPEESTQPPAPPKPQLP